MAGDSDARWMDEALAVATQGLARGELPIGAIVVVDDEVVGRAHTQERAQRRLLVHADLLALDEADRVLGDRRRRATLYVTLEPCMACLGAAMTTMVGRIVYALESPADGASAVASAWDEARDSSAFPGYRLPAIEGGVLRDRSIDLFRAYVAAQKTGGAMTAWAAGLANLGGTRKFDSAP